MSFEGFFRLFWSQIAGAIVLCGVIWLVARLTIKYTTCNIQEAEAVHVWLRRGSRIAIALVALILAISILSSASLNLFPRADIDRSGLNQQNEQWQERHSK